MSSGSMLWFWIWVLNLSRIGCWRARAPLRESTWVGFVMFVFMVIFMVMFIVIVMVMVIIIVIVIIIVKVSTRAPLRLMSGRP